MSPHLMEIEEALSAPTREAALAHYDATLRALSERLAQTLRAGVPPEDFTPISNLGEATTLARKLLRLTVQEAQGTPSSNVRRADVDV